MKKTVRAACTGPRVSALVRGRRGGGKESGDSRLLWCAASSDANEPGCCGDRRRPPPSRCPQVAVHDENPRALDGQMACHRVRGAVSIRADEHTLIAYMVGINRTEVPVLVITTSSDFCCEMPHEAV